MNNKYSTIARLRKYPFRDRAQVENCWQHMAEFIYNCLLQYKKYNRHTHPWCEGADTEEKWEAILDDMIWAFGEIQNQEKIKAFAEMNEADQAAYDEKIRNGLQLFCKYFKCLWD